MDHHPKYLLTLQGIREAKLRVFKGQKVIALMEEDWYFDAKHHDAKHCKARGTENIYKKLKKHTANIEKNIELWGSLTESKIIEMYRKTKQ